MKEPQQTVNPVVLSGVIALCLVAGVLMLLLPGDSLVIDLVYRGF
jgi:hypothetical protein